MVTPTEYSLMADAAYFDIRGDANQPVQPTAKVNGVRSTFQRLAR
jgi:hypothetical protein